MQNFLPPTVLAQRGLAERYPKTGAFFLAFRAALAFLVLAPFQGDHELPVDLFLCRLILLQGLLTGAYK